MSRKKWGFGQNKFSTFLKKVLAIFLEIPIFLNMETILTFAPELNDDPEALAQFEASYSDFLDALDTQGEE